MKEEIKLYSLPCGPRCGNAGDAVARMLVRHFLKKPVDIVLPDQADIVATGSVLQDIPSSYEGVVWGTGLIFERLRADIPHADIRCVRGHLTAARVNGGLVDPVVGDTGLLVDKLSFPKTGGKRYDVGIIPHYIDEDNHGVVEWLRTRWNATSIDICGRVPDVLRAISECSFILSSSLHGLIFADSLSVPNAWIVLSNKIGGGSSFKFRDYYSVFGITDPIPFPFQADVRVEDIMRQPWERPGLEEIKERLKASLLEDYGHLPEPLLGTHGQEEESDRTGSTGDTREEAKEAREPPCADRCHQGSVEPADLQ